MLWFWLITTIQVMSHKSSNEFNLAAMYAASNIIRITKLRKNLYSTLIVFGLRIIQNILDKFLKILNIYKNTYFNKKLFSNERYNKRQPKMQYRSILILITISSAFCTKISRFNCDVTIQIGL